MLFYNFVSSTVSVRYIDSAAYYKRINDKVVNLFSLNDLLLKTKKQKKQQQKYKKKKAFIYNYIEICNYILRSNNRLVND